jgi:hypothetical protein
MFYDFMCTTCHAGCFYEDGIHTKEECQKILDQRIKWKIPLSVSVSREDILRAEKTGKGRMYDGKDKDEFSAEDIRKRRMMV